MTMLQQQQLNDHQRPACMITIEHTAPPLYVETTQAEFRAVVQRLTAGSNNKNNNSSQTLHDHYNLPYSTSQSEASSSPRSPVIAASNRRRPRRRVYASSGVPRSGSSESLWNASNSATAHDQGIVISDVDGDHYSTLSDASPPSCSKKIKLPMCHPAHIVYNGVQESAGYNTHGTTSLPPLPSSSSSLHTSSPSASPWSDQYQYPSSPSGGYASPATDPPAVISHTTGQLTAINPDEYDHNDYHDHDDFHGAFFCDSPSLPPLMDIIDDHQQLELFTTFHADSSTSTLYSSPISTNPPSQLYHTTDQWDALNRSFSWKDDDFLCV